ncbi:hypothetical protein NEF87_002959 [Candidatus Lokiarchaeum ossiferum]|uniref:Acyltransferase n=1 Tax=Candidatus Lokiarchaeum ossiferum TaxID=2951803 RepID=A0ABY6HT43_9ARCH|nr:hypothetical protein NEF87_002959 [Candidatus Lokiarchaeum sp. B-35]
MAHVMYFDQKKHPKSAINAGTNWAESVGYVFWFLKRWIRYRMYLLIRWIPLTIQEGIAGVLGQLFLGFSRKNQIKVQQSFNALYKHRLSTKRLKHLYRAHCSYMGKLVIDFMNGLPLRIDQDVSEFITFKHLDRLDSALKQGKGAIIPCLHLGQLVHLLYALAKHPTGYTIATIFFAPNIVTYEFTNRTWATNTYLYASTKYSRVAPYLQAHLAQNHLVILFHDYGTRHQMRVPFCQGVYPYLIHTPQSVVKLHKDTGAPIIPCINTPAGVVGKTSLNFLDNSSLVNISQKYQNKSKKEFHGRMSTELNRLMNPSLRKFSHVWEEITDFATTRIADQLIVPPMINLQELILLVAKKSHQILEKSYEPGRDDASIHELLQEMFLKIRSSLTVPETILVQASETIDLSQMNALSEIQTLCSYVKNLLQKASHFDEDVSINLITQLKEELKKLKY